MKRVLKMTCAAAVLSWSVCSFADVAIGVVDMRVIMQSAPQVKQINDQLNKEFSSKRDTIVQKSKALELDIQKLNRDQAVMDKKALENARNSVNKRGVTLREEQTKYQQALFAAQNEGMNKLMGQVAEVVKGLSGSKQLDIVVPKNSVIYSKENMDVTNEVLDGLKKQG